MLPRPIKLETFFIHDVTDGELDHMVQLLNITRNKELMVDYAAANMDVAAKKL